MTRSALLAARRLIAACLMFALALSGAGRVVMAAPIQPDMASVVIAGYTVPLCATDDGAGRGTAGDHPQICDQCPLCAPTLLPESAAFSRPIRPERIVQPVELPLPASHVPAPRSPRQSQGPPAA